MLEAKRGLNALRKPIVDFVSCRVDQSVLRKRHHFVSSNEN